MGHSRREFFRTFGRESIRQAGAVAGAAAELRRSSMEATRSLLEPDVAGEQETPPTDPTRPDSTYRSPYRFTGDAIVALDLRALPGKVQTLTLTAPSEVAAAIRTGVLSGGPVLAEVAAYAMVLAFRNALDRPPVGRHQHMRAAAGTLRSAHREARALAHGVDRLEARYDELADHETEPSDLAAALQAEADLVASAGTAACLAIGRFGAEVLGPGSGTLNLIAHADMGPLACGMVGMLTAVVTELGTAGRSVHVWLTEAAPSGEGGRIAAAQLRQLDIEHTVVADTAVAWLLDRQKVDALVLRGDRIAANGDTTVLLGGLGAARLAAAAGVPVHVLAPRIAIDVAAADAAALRADMPHVAGTARLNPTTDIVPADLIGSFITDAGLLEPPYRVALSKALG